MRNIAKIALIVFVLMLEVGYADDCREELYEKYKAHSAEFIKLKNKCKPLLENVERLAKAYRNRVEFKEYKSLTDQYLTMFEKWEKSAECREAERITSQCLQSPEHKAHSKRKKELEDIIHKTQAYKAMKQEKTALDIEINATCKLFLDGVYDIDRAFERIAKATYKSKKANDVFYGGPQYKAYLRQVESPYSLGSCIDRKFTAEKKYLAAYNKLVEAAKKALEPLQTAFRNSQEVKEYVAECRGITFPAYYDMMKYFDFGNYWNWREDYIYEEGFIIVYIQSIIANRP